MRPNKIHPRLNPRSWGPKLWVATTLCLAVVYCGPNTNKAAGVALGRHSEGRSLFALPKSSQAPCELDRWRTSTADILRQTDVHRLEGILIRDGHSFRFVYNRSTGQIDPAQASPKVYRLASVSKWILGLVAHRQLQQGRITLETEVKKNLPSMSNPSAQMDSMTFGHLLSHRAGLFDNYQALTKPSWYQALRSPSLSAEQSLQRLLSIPRQAPPNKQFAYSGAGFALAAAVLEQSSGQGYPQLVRSLAQTVGASTLGFLSDPHMPKAASGYAQGRRPGIAPWTYGNQGKIDISQHPGSGLFGSIHDLEKLLPLADQHWAQWALKNGKELQAIFRTTPLERRHPSLKDKPYQLWRRAWSGYVRAYGYASDIYLPGFWLLTQAEWAKLRAMVVRRQPKAIAGLLASTAGQMQVRPTDSPPFFTGGSLPYPPVFGHHGSLNGFESYVLVARPGLHTHTYPGVKPVPRQAAGLLLLSSGTGLEQHVDYWISSLVECAASNEL